MIRRLAPLLLLLAGSGCGPNLMTVANKRQSWVPTAKCSAGPFVIKTFALGARYGENLEITFSHHRRAVFFLAVKVGEGAPVKTTLNMGGKAENRCLLKRVTAPKTLEETPVPDGKAYLSPRDYERHPFEQMTVYNKYSHRTEPKYAYVSRYKTLLEVKPTGGKWRLEFALIGVRSIARGTPITITIWSPEPVDTSGLLITLTQNYYRKNKNTKIIRKR